MESHVTIRNGNGQFRPSAAHQLLNTKKMKRLEPDKRLNRLIIGHHPITEAKWALPSLVICIPPNGDGGTKFRAKRSISRCSMFTKKLESNAYIHVCKDIIFTKF